MTKTKFQIAFGVLLLAGLFALAKAGQAATYYVDGSGGSDSNSGIPWQTAKKTIQAGADILSSGDTLKIKSGTYNEGFKIDGKSFANWVTIETDDGSGNPGSITLSGTVPTTYVGSTDAAIWIHNTNYIKIDGRKSDGFNIPVNAGAGAEYGVIFHSGSDSNHHAKLLYATIKGTITGSGSDASAISSSGYSDLEIGYNKIDISSGSEFLIQVQSGGGPADPNPAGTALIHHNDIAGVTSEGYSAISFTRFDKGKVYANYIHSVRASGTGSTILRSRQGNDNEFYNNVILNAAGTNVKNFAQARAGGAGAQLADRNKVYNNTFIIEGNLSECVFHIDQGSGNEIFNNLVLGNIPYFVGSWGSARSNNKLYSNIVTGSVGSWFEGSIGNSFSVNQNNLADQGTSFINLAGSQPSPYWDLKVSKDGMSVSGLSTDYDGNSRGNPPDVGAFEYGGGGPVPTPTPTPTPPPGGKKGDLNNDSRVDVIDLGIFLSNWGATSRPSSDLNQDGKVDVIDLGILLSNWG